MIMAVLVALVVAVLPTSPAAAAVSMHYALLPESSRVHIHTGSSGLFGFAGHEHTIAAEDLTGHAAVDSTDLSAFTVSMTFPADSLRVIDEGRDQDSRAKIERDMRQKTLESSRFPRIEVRGVTFAPKRADPASTQPMPLGDCSGTIVIELALHGTTRTLTLPIDLEINADRLRARGELTIRHEDFGMKRVKVAGVVNVAEELAIDFDIHGRRVRQR
jgi:polyisoprenoid-binding protein YceI